MKEFHFSCVCLKAQTHFEIRIKTTNDNQIGEGTELINFVTYLHSVSKIPSSIKCLQMTKLFIKSPNWIDKHFSFHCFG